MPHTKDIHLRDPRLMRLALKYAYIWKTRCGALRAKTHCTTGDRCSVHHVILRAFDGRIQVLLREQLPRLKAGTEPFGDGRVKARLRDLPPQLPPDLYYVPLDIVTYLGTDVPDFAALLFTAPTRVYLLLPSLMREPRWLRDLFVKLRDPATGNHVSAPVTWELGSGFKLVLATGLLYQAFMRQRFSVWESIKVYGVDEELVLGGPGLAEMGDTLFVIATRSLQPLQPLQATQGLQTHLFQQHSVQAQGSPQLLYPSPAVPAVASSAFPSPQLHPYLPPSLPYLLRRASRFASAEDGSPVPTAATGTVPLGAVLPSPAPPPPLLAVPSTTSHECPSPVRPSDCRLVPLEAADGAAALPASGRSTALGVAGAGTGGGGATSLAVAGTSDADPWARVSRPSLLARRPGEDVADGGAAAASGAGGGGPGGSARLLQRFVKVVKRDRLHDLRALLESEPWQRACPSADEVSFLPAGERWPLTVDLAVANVSVPVLAELVDRAGCHLNYRSLKLLVAHWDRLPEHCAGGGEGLLLRYLARKPNPLSVLGACLLAMRAELGAGRNHSTALQGAVSRFKVLQGELLSQIQDTYFRISEEARLEAGLPLLEDILEQPQAMVYSGTASAAAGGAAAAAAPPPFPPQPIVLSDYSPLRLAFRDHDTQFMSAQLIEGYTRRRWLGPEFSALTLLDGHNRLSGLDPMFVYTITENLGFVGEAGSASMAATMRLWHLVTLTSPAFFRSPRGRWAMKFMSTVVFLALYMTVLVSYKKIRLPASAGGGSWRALHTFFLVFTAGNLLESAEVMTMRYRNSAGRYFASAPGEVLGVLVDVGIFASVAPCLVAAYTDSLADGAAAAVTDAGANAGWGVGGGTYNGGGSRLSSAQWTMLRLSLSTLAIFVWMRSLVIMVPLYRKLGPMIRTMTRMGGEILAFVPLYVSVTLGFAAAMHSAIGDQVQEYHTFVAAVLHLFEATLGTFEYALFDALDDRNRLYAQILMTVYLVLAAILLTNLLIAIISYKYRPEEVRAESVFDLAELVDRYRFQVKHNLICSPFNLVQLVLAWMPAAPMPKLPPYEWVKYGLTPLDGLTFATPRFPTTTGGRHEIPHLCYLLTLYPLLIISANVLYYLHAPYAVLYWALIGHRKLLRELLGSKDAAAASTKGGGGGSGPSGGGGGAPGNHALSGPSYAASSFAATAAAAAASLTARYGAGGDHGGGSDGAGAGVGALNSAGLRRQRVSFDAKTGSGARSCSGAAGVTAGVALLPPGDRQPQSLTATSLPVKPSHFFKPQSPLLPTQQQHQQQHQTQQHRPPRRGDSRLGREVLVPGPQQQQGRPSGEEPRTSSFGGDGWARSSGSGRWTTSATSVPDALVPTGPGAAVAADRTRGEQQPTANPQPPEQRQQQGQQELQQEAARRLSGPVAEKVERVAAGVAGMDVEALPLPLPLPAPPRAPRGDKPGNDADGVDGIGVRQRLRAKSLRSMQTYILSANAGSSSSRSMSARVDDLNLYDDPSDAAAVQPPYMALLRLATLSGLLDALLSTLRFLVLVVLGAVLYVVIMGFLAGTLGCCLTGWVGSVGVSMYRIVAGAWIGARQGDGEAAAQASAGGGGARGNGAAAAGAAAAPAAAPSSWVSLARRARSRHRSTYLRRAQVEAAIRSVYAASNILSVWTPASQPSSLVAPRGGGGGGGAAAAAAATRGNGAAAGAGVSGVSGSGWAAAASKIGLGPFQGGDGGGGDGGNGTSGPLAPPRVPPQPQRQLPTASTALSAPPRSQRAIQTMGPSLPPADVTPELLEVSEWEQDVIGGGEVGAGSQRSRTLAAGYAATAAAELESGAKAAAAAQWPPVSTAAAASSPPSAAHHATETTHGPIRMARTTVGIASPAAVAAVADVGSGAVDGASGGLLRLPIPRVLSLTARSSVRVAPATSGNSRKALVQPVLAAGAADEGLLLPPLPRGVELQRAAACSDGVASAALGSADSPAAPYSDGAFNIPGAIASVSGRRSADNESAMSAAMVAAAALPPTGVQGDPRAPAPSVSVANEVSALREQVAALSAVVQQLASMIGPHASAATGRRAAGSA